jgi:hypothetical protein
VVSVFDASTHAFIKGVFTNPAGYYEFKSLAAGTYHVRFTGTTPANLTQYFNAASAITAATDVVVTTAGWSDVSADLSPLAPPATQTITGTITDNSGPLSGVVVSAFTADGHVYTKGVATNASGVYTMTGIPAGTYHLRFTGTPLAQYFDHSSTITGASIVTVAGGGTTTVSSNLSPAVPVTVQSIGGVISDNSGPLSGIVVTAYDATTHTYVKAGFTSASGVYLLSLPAGSYHLRFTGTPLTQYYDHATSITGATTVVVPSGTAVPISSNLSPQI